MQIGTKRHRAPTKIASGDGVRRYKHRLDLYTIPPTENISLQEFEDFAVERLKVLKVVETVGIRCVKGTEDYSQAMGKEFRQLRSQGALKGLLTKSTQDNKGINSDDLEERRKDHISHFILRLAYSRTEELRRWFIAQELDLFRYRFNQESKESICQFLDLNHLDYKPIPDSEKNTVLTELIAASKPKAEHTNFYKVQFTEAVDLVRGRKVFLKDGYAYVPQSDLVVIILSVFRSNLSHALTVASRALPQLEEDSRLLPMLSGLSKRYLGQDYSNKKPATGNITADRIEGLSKTSFPLCMQQVHQSFRQHHHLKHWGRMQYGLFLKGIGLSLDEAMKFWRAEFTKIVDPDKFDKTYAYNIRHNYGKEGKRADYTPYSCIKIITTNAPGPGDYHGCPFRHTDSDLLKQKLQGQRVPKDVVDEIVQLCKTSHYQLACGRYFDWSHKLDSKFNPNHPNHYFEESQRVISGEKPSEETNSQPRGVKIVSASQSQKSQNMSRISEDSFEDFPLSAEDLDVVMKAVDS